MSQSVLVPSRSGRPVQPRRRRPLLIPSVVVAVAATLGSVWGTVSPALGEKPAGAQTEMYLVPQSVLNPTTADALGSGSWSSLINASALRSDLTSNKAAWGCGGEWPAVAFVVASADPSAPGSAERPRVTPGGSIWDAFAWSDGGGTIPHDFPQSLLYSKAEVDTLLAGGADLSLPLSKRWAAGQRISMVAFCTSGVDANGLPSPAADADGYAITSWLTFTTSASTTNPTLTSDGFKVDAAKVASNVTLNDSWVGGVGTLTATVASGDATVTDVPTGTVEFYTGTGASRTLVGTSPVGATGTATLALSGMAAGSQTTYRADYVPAATETHYKASTSAPYTVFSPAATATVLAVTGSLSVGSSQTFTATVTPSTAAGSVSFKDGTTTLGTATVANGKATVTKALALGEHSVTATFAPADELLFATSTSAAQSVSITAKQVPTVSLTAAKGTYGRATRATVRVTAGSAGAAGAVVVTLDGKALATPTLIAGAATVTLPAGTAAGTHVLAASYAGSATLAAGSARQSVLIAKAATRTALTITPKRVTKALAKKGKVKAVVTVTVPGASVKASGTVVVKVGSAKTTGTLKGGKVTVKLPKSTAKKLKVVVSFAGSANFAGSSASATVKVSR